MRFLLTGRQRHPTGGQAASLIADQSATRHEIKFYAKIIQKQNVRSF